MIDWLAEVPQWLVSLAVAGSALLLGLISAGVFRVIGSSIARRNQAEMLLALFRKSRGPLRVIFPVLFLAAVAPFVAMPAPLAHAYQDILRVALISATLWAALRTLAVIESSLLDRFNVEVADNLKARKVHTQIRVIRRILVAFLLVIGLSALLLTFEPVRQIGTTLLASAGLLGLVVGFAAQKTLGLIVAGLQVALAQPIRIDDVVIVEGEWGRIEEITLTYVVIRIWDRRRLVVPVSHFIEKPFQNWTRVSADMLGSVFLYVDYTFPVPVLRQRLREILQQSPLWDQEVCVLQVTESREHTLELRALMTARDSPTLWDLRCEVREKLVEFIQQNYPEQLPRLRAELPR